MRSIFSRDAAVPAVPHAREAPDAALAALDTALQGIDRKLHELREIAVPQLQMAAIMERERILAERRYDDPLRLERCGYSVYSQNDEDGILAEIFRRIGTTDHTFLEFGVEGGLENNTLCLLEQGWSGAWIEADASRVSAMEKGFRRWLASGRLAVRNAVVTRDNIGALMRELRIPRAPDLLSIDIDGNDYHVWEAIDAIEPRAVVVEYNARFPPPMQWVMDYDPAHRWDGTDQYGASLESLTALGVRKGYVLVGCSITGTNAFFVQSTLAGNRFARPATAAALYQPPRYYLLSSFTAGHPAGYSRSRMP